MASKYWRIASWPALVSLLGAPILMNCGGKMPGAPAMPAGMPSVPGAPGNCPNMADAEAVANFDWSKEFKLDAQASGKLKGGVQAAINLKELSAQIDGDLKGACGNIVKDLGGSGEFATGKDACDAAIKVMGEVRAKLGASAKITLDAVPP